MGMVPKRRSVVSFFSGQLLATTSTFARFAEAHSRLWVSPISTLPVWSATFSACARSILRLRLRLDLRRGGLRAHRGRPVDEVHGPGPQGDGLPDDDVLRHALQ